MNSLVPRFIQQQFAHGQLEGSFTAASLFVDISGFTPLTDTLFDNQKDGAEVLTETLKNIFSPMVHEVYAHGGLIPYYAGDAFTAIFPILPEQGENTIVQACHRATETAFAIRKRFTSDGNHRLMQTKYGTFAIAIKIGLSCGEVNWAIPGENTQHNYYFRGSAIDNCVQQEQIALAGEIVADKQFVVQIADHVTAVSHPQHPQSYYLNQFEHQTERLPIIDEPACPKLLTQFLSDSILNLNVQAEFREAAIVFVSFDDKQARKQQLHHFLTACINITAQYGGTFNQIDFSDKGGLLVLLFGAPLSYEQNAERAVECLYALKKQSWAQSNIRWRAGVTMGTVWAGLRGSKERLEYGVVGSVVNLAARLSVKAGWNEVWVSESVYQKLQDSYWLGELGDFKIKGKAGKVPIFQLLRKKDSSEIEKYKGRLVGRQEEMARLETAVSPIFNNQYAGITYVHGEAGMGKSRFVYEFHRQLMQNHFLSWFFCPTEEILGHSLYPFRAFLRDYFQQDNEISQEENKTRFTAVFDLLLQQLSPTDPLRTALKRQRPLLAKIVSLSTDSTKSDNQSISSKFQLQPIATAIATLIRAEAFLRPVVVQIEDVHWLDAESYQLLQLLVELVDQAPIAFICTARYFSQGERFQLLTGKQLPQTYIDLLPFNAQQIKQLGNQLLRTRIHDDVVSLLVERTNSNPFFVEQLLLDMRGQGLLKTTLDAQGAFYTLASTAYSTLPANINMVLTSRLDQLPLDVKSTIQTAAVLGRQVDVQLLAHMLPMQDNLSAQIKRAEAEQVWEAQADETIFTFKHSLLRDAAYEMQLRARLRELHQKAAEAYLHVYGSELESHYAEVAFHYEHALMSLEAARWYRVAGEQAARFYANSEAISYYSKGLELLPQTADSERYAILRAREEIYLLRGQRNAQLADLREMRKISHTVKDDLLLADCNLRFAAYYKTTGDYATALESAETAVNLARQTNAHHIEMAAQLLWGQTLLLLGELEDAKKQLHIVTQRAQTTSLLNLKADGLSTLATLHDQLGMPEQATQYLNQALPIYQALRDRQGESNILIHLGTVFSKQGQFFDADHCFRKAKQIAGETGDMQLLAQVAIHLGVLAHELGQYHKSIKFLEDALGQCKDIGLKSGEGLSLIYLSHCYHSLEDGQKALTLAKQAMTIAKSLSDPILMGYALQALGLAYLLLDKLTQAATIFLHVQEKWLELEQHALFIETLATQAELYLLQNNARKAVNNVEQILNHLAQGNHIHGAHSPIEIYLTCYKVLTHIQDIRATALLESAHMLLQQRAALIFDEETKNSYLYNVKAHQFILDAMPDYLASTIG